MLHARRGASAHPLAPEPWTPALCATLLVAACLALCAALHVAAGSSGPVPGLAAESAFVGTALTVTGDPRRIELTAHSRDVSGSASGAPQTALVLVPVRITRITTGSGEVYAVGSSATVMARPRTSAQLDAWLGLLPSERLLVSGRMREPRGGTREAALLFADGGPDVVGGPSLVQEFAGRLRTDLREAVSGLPLEAAATLPALAIGDVSQEPPELANALKSTGLAYLVVASGEKHSQRGKKRYRASYDSAFTRGAARFHLRPQLADLEAWRHVDRGSEA
jgi:competence protein ComEC